MSELWKVKETVSHASSLNYQAVVVHASRRLSLLSLGLAATLKELDYLVRPIPSLCLGRMLSNHCRGTKQAFFTTRSSTRAEKSDQST